MARSVTTMLMFDGDAEAAMNLYVSLFPGSAVTHIERYDPGDQGAEGAVKRGGFTLNGREFICFDTPVNHDFTFTPSISIYVDCESEAELTQAFERLSQGGEVKMALNDYGFSKRFGWLTDRFGVSWQLNVQ